MLAHVDEDDALSPCENTPTGFEDEALSDEDFETIDTYAQLDQGTPFDPSMLSPSASETRPDNGELPAHEEAGTGGATSPKKRKSHAVDDHGKAKPVKKRASQACEVCRNRKVRCDSEKRHPCTNCSDMQLLCVIPESKRRRRQTNPSIAAQVILPNTWALQADTPPLVVLGRDYGDSPASAEARPYTGPLRPFTVDSRPRRPAHSAQSSWTYAPAIAPSQYARRQEAEDGQARAALVPMAFKRPALGKTPTAALRYLQAVGALDTPPRHVEQALLVAYIEHVHSEFPILDLRSFLRALSDRDGRQGQTSLLLYQSVMFAASAFIKPDHLAATGYSTRRALRIARMSAAQALYDSDYEKDKLVLLQSAFLLSFYYEAPEDAKESWYWSSIAISQAQALGLHRQSVSQAETDPAAKRLRKRIWWSCVMRDRQIGLGMARLLRIKDDDFDIPMLEENDFDIAELDQNLLVTALDCPMMFNVRMQQKLAEICIQKARLYVVVGQVLQAVQKLHIASTTPTYSFTKNHQKDFQNAHDSLEAWRGQLRETCDLSRKLSGPDIEHDGAPVVMQRALLQLLYQTTYGKIYHPLIRPVPPVKSAYPPMHAARMAEEDKRVQDDMAVTSRLRCRYAAEQVTSMFSAMVILGLVAYMPTTAVTFVMPATLMHLQGVSDLDSATSEAAVRGFEACMTALKVLSTTYAAAEYGARYLCDLISRKPWLEHASNTARPPAPLAPPAGQQQTGASPDEPRSPRTMSISSRRRFGTPILNYADKRATPAMTTKRQSAKALCGGGLIVSQADKPSDSLESPDKELPPLSLEVETTPHHPGLNILGQQGSPTLTAALPTTTPIDMYPNNDTKDVDMLIASGLLTPSPSTESAELPGLLPTQVRQEWERPPAYDHAAFQDHFVAESLALNFSSMEGFNIQSDDGWTRFFNVPNDQDSTTSDDLDPTPEHSF